MGKVGIIIQARKGSTRLPGKMLMPFYEDHSLAEIIFSKLKTVSAKYPVILATSTDHNNDKLAELAKKCGLLIFRGSEDNVLERFIEAATQYQVDTVVRVCADNPFLSVIHIEELINKFEDIDVDYLSYAFPGGRPVIKSHIGLFVELVKLSALKKVIDYTDEKLYLEHVTNFIYANPDKFKVKFIDVPGFLTEKTNIRLTVDTKEDFLLAKELYDKFIETGHIEKDIDIEELIGFISENEKYLNIMKNEIIKNEK